MKTDTPTTHGNLGLYRVKVILRNGASHIWERYGVTMEKCLSAAKVAASKQYGDAWDGEIAIASHQGEGIYFF